MKVFELVLEGMNPWVKSVMFSVLALPMVLAISAMIMQVNAGSVIQDYLELKLLEKELQIKAAELVHPSDAAWRKEIEDWICSHKKEPDEVPDFCKEVTNHKVVTDDHHVVYPAPIPEAP